MDTKLGSSLLPFDISLCPRSLTRGGQAVCPAARVSSEHLPLGLASQPPLPYLYPAWARALLISLSLAYWRKWWFDTAK